MRGWPVLLLLFAAGGLLACDGDAVPGSLVVESVPPGADVLVDGKPVGATPYTVEPSPLVGERDRTVRIALSLDGHRTWRRSVVVHGQSAQKLQVHLAPRGSGGGEIEDFEVEEAMLLIKAGQGWAVTIDGRPATASPSGHASLVAAGTHTVVLKGSGGETHTYRVKVSDPGPAEVTLDEVGAEAVGNEHASKLEYLGCEGCEKARKRPSRAVAPAAEATAELAINTKPPASVFVDGEETGRRTPIWPSEPLRLTPGKHEIRFVTASGDKFVYRIWVGAEKMINKLIIKRLGGRHSGNVRGEYIGRER